MCFILTPDWTRIDVALGWSCGPVVRKMVSNFIGP